MQDFAKRFQASCPCCGFATLTDSIDWSYEICPLCFWENDPVQRGDASYIGGDNSISLLQARENFIRFGACRPQSLDHIRPPRTDEVPFPNSLSGLDLEQRTAAIRLRKAQILKVIGQVRTQAIPGLDGCAIIAILASGVPVVRSQNGTMSDESVTRSPPHVRARNSVLRHELND